ncbi:hypothetical protein RJG79_09040 [Mycoplasmatota bacterium WC44]
MTGVEDSLGFWLWVIIYLCIFGLSVSLLIWVTGIIKYKDFNWIKNVKRNKLK